MAIQPLIQGDEQTYSMFTDYRKYDSVLELRRYSDESALMAEFEAIVTAAAEAKASELIARQANA